jgi:hypothetical protein
MAKRGKIELQGSRDQSNLKMFTMDDLPDISK